MKKLVFLFIMAMFLGSLASATDYHFTKGDETTTYSTKLMDVWNTLTPADKVYLDDSSVYYIETAQDDGWGVLPLPCPIIGTSAVKPTITWKADTTGSWGLVTTGTNAALKNLIFDNGGAWLPWRMPLITRNIITLYMVDLVRWGGNAVIAFDGLVGNTPGGTFEYVTCNEAGSVYQNDINATYPPTAADFKPVLFNHCTFVVNNGAPAFNLNAKWLTDGSEITVKNCIIVQADQTNGMDVFYANSATLGEAINHHHNLYGKIATLDFNQVDGDVSNFAGMAAKGEIGGLDVVTDPVFFNAPSDLRIAGASPAFGKADDGKNIGADVSSVPVELSAFELE